MGLVGCMLLGFSTWNTASAAVLTLLDWTTVPIPSGAHPDRYTLPYDLLFPISGKTITTVEMDYQNQPFVPGDHPIQSIAFLFASGDVLSTTVFESTSQRYRARVVFKPTSYFTNFTDPFAPALVAMHGPIGGGTLTSAQWTVTYTDSTTATSNNGIIPEPGSAAFIAIASTIGFFRRRVPRRH